MAKEHVQRRLAEIIAADVVGYSRLIREDGASGLSGATERRVSQVDPAGRFSSTFPSCRRRDYFGGSASSSRSGRRGRR